MFKLDVYSPKTKCFKISSLLLAHPFFSFAPHHSSLLPQAERTHDFQSTPSVIGSICRHTIAESEANRKPFLTLCGCTVQTHTHRHSGGFIHSHVGVSSKRTRLQFFVSVTSLCHRVWGRFSTMWKRLSAFLSVSSGH